jgi:hypothetical protein
MEILPVCSSILKYDHQYNLLCLSRFLLFHLPLIFEVVRYSALILRQLRDYRHLRYPSFLHLRFHG